MSPEDHTVPEHHPRYESLMLRERVIEQYEKGIVATAGLFAHGRGEAFDYLLGEKTQGQAIEAVEAAAAALLTSEYPVISVNGNAAALCAKEMIELSKMVDAKVEVNLFYRSEERELAIKRLLELHGATEVLGFGDAARIPELTSERRRVDPEGILRGDTVLVALEDGDRTEALTRLGKKVIAIDLNPLSRTSKAASITVVDNVIRAVPALISEAHRLKSKGREELAEILRNFNNSENLRAVIGSICRYLKSVCEDI